MYMMVRTQLLLPEDLLNDLRAIAVSEKTSVSHMIRVLAADKVKKKMKKKMSGIEAIEQMIKYGERHPNPQTPRDLSTNDDYLYGKNAP
jgi:hypothetical protein